MEPAVDFAVHARGAPSRSAGTPQSSPARSALFPRKNVGMDDLSIRRPDLLNVLRLGTVRWWKEDKGYGRITADDGEVLFVHFSEVVLDGFRALEEGQRVSFVWRGSQVAHGRHAAEEVRVVGVSVSRNPTRKASSAIHEQATGERLDLRLEADATGLLAAR